MTRPTTLEELHHELQQARATLHEVKLHLAFQAADLYLARQADEVDLDSLTIPPYVQEIVARTHDSITNTLSRTPFPPDAS